VLYNNDVFGFVNGSKAAPSKKVAAVTGSSDLVDNLEYAIWFKQDQQV
jgi:hypothetical protein